MKTFLNWLFKNRCDHKGQIIWACAYPWCYRCGKNQRRKGQTEKEWADNYDPFIEFNYINGHLQGYKRA